MNNMAKKIIRLTEEELIKHIHKVVNEAINEREECAVENKSVYQVWNTDFKIDIKVK